MSEGFFPVINVEDLPATNEVRYTFDVGPYVRQAVEQVAAAVETYAEAEAVRILRKKGYYVLDQRGREGAVTEHRCMACGKPNHAVSEPTP